MDNPNNRRFLKNLGSKIASSNLENDRTFKSLTEINTNHIKCNLIYANFLQEIANEE